MEMSVRELKKKKNFLIGLIGDRVPLESLEDVVSHPTKLIVSSKRNHKATPPPLLIIPL